MMMLKKLKIAGIVLGIFFAAGNVFSADGREAADLKTAEQYSRESNQLYQKAVTQYRKVLAESKNPEEIYYRLGKLYYQHADYTLAIESLLNVKSKAAQKLLAVSYYKTGQYTQALSIFNKLGDLADDVYLYHYALTCETHNLYDQALGLYAKIHSEPLKAEAEKRTRAINALTERTDLKTLDPSLQKLIAQSPSPEEFPQAGAVVLLVEEEIEVKEDNTVEHLNHYLIKILNERGKHYGEIQVTYDSTYDKVKIELARTIRPDGQVISVGSKHIRDVSLYHDFPLYSNVRATIISMPEVSTGAFIEYKVRSSSATMVAKDNFRIEYLLQEADPIKHAKFTITLPKGRYVNQRIINEQFNTLKIDLKPKILSEKSKNVYTWEFRDIPQIIPEPAMPPVTEITPIVLLSTFKSWDQIYQWWWQLAADKIDTNQEIKNKVQELIKDKKTLKEKARAIYDFCSRDIRYVAIEYGQAGYEPHRATEIFSNKYGDCKDQAILLIAMLKEAGISAYPVLIGTKGMIPAEDNFPTVIFNHCIAVARLGEELVFLDPTSETTLFGDLPQGDQGRRVLVSFEKEGKLLTTPKFSAEHNTMRTKTVLEFDDKEIIKASRMVSTSGVFGQSQRYALRYTMPVLIEEGIKATSQRLIPAAKLIDYHIDNLDSTEKDIVLSYHFVGTDFLTKAGPQARIIPQLGDVDTGLVAKDTRQYAIDFNIPYDQEEIFEIHLPSRYRVKYLPETFIKETPWFRYENSYRHENGKITFTEKKTSKADRVTVEDYARYKSAVEALAKDTRQCIILERNN